MLRHLHGLARSSVSDLSGMSGKTLPSARKVAARPPAARAPRRSPGATAVAAPDPQPSCTSTPRRAPLLTRPPAKAKAASLGGAWLLGARGRARVDVVAAAKEGDDGEGLLDFYAGLGRASLEQPAWSYVDEGLVDINSDAKMAQIYGEILRGRIPLQALMADQDVKMAGYLALLVAIGNARHWEAARKLYNFMLDNTSAAEIPTDFYLHLALKRMEDQQNLPALEVFAWYKGELRPPSSHALELFARVAGRCSDTEKASPEYKAAYEWFYNSDAGRALWHVYMGGPKRNAGPDDKEYPTHDDSEF